MLHSFDAQGGRSDLDNPHWRLGLMLWVDAKSSSTATDNLMERSQSHMKGRHPNLIYFFSLDFHFTAFLQ